MEFRLLGSLEAIDGDAPIALGGPRQRALLGLLLLRANESVSRDWLIDELWEERPPRSGATALHNQVARLRRILGPHRVLTRPDGYALRVDPGELDLDRFLALLGEAAGLDAEGRSELLREALALWHGTPLGGLSLGRFTRTEIARLEELRLAALEDRIDAELELGRHADLVAELTALVPVHPLSERLRGQLIITLYRCGRQAEALDVYRETRQLLADELGLEPSPALKDLERAILRHDPGLAPAARTPRSKPAPVVVAPPARRRLTYALGGIVLLLAGGGAAFLMLRGNAPEGASALATAPTAPARSVPAPPVKTAAPVKREAQPAKRKTTLRKSAQARPKRPVPPPVEAAAPAPAAQLAPPAKPEPTAAAAQRAATVETAKPAATTAAAPPATAKGMTPAVTPPPPPAKKTPAAKPKPFTIADDFSETTLDPFVWYTIGKENGAIFTQREGRLEIEIAPDAQPSAQWNQVGGHYGTHCSFTSDFDARVDFELLVWPDGSGAYAGLNLFFAHAAIARQSSARWGDQYTAWVDSAGHGIPLPDRTGRLRMARVNGVITTYIWMSDHWQKVVSGTSRGASVIGLQLEANGDEFSRTPVRVAFDNFAVTATQADCPSFADPRG